VRFMKGRSSQQVGRVVEERVLKSRARLSAERKLSALGAEAAFAVHSQSGFKYRLAYKQ
jgi:hypothetical protein